MDDELQQGIEQDIYLKPKEIDWEQLAKDLGAQLVETARLLEYHQGGQWQSYLSVKAKGLLGQVDLMEEVPPFEVWYIKPSGKFYTEGRLHIPKAIRDGKVAYMYDAKDCIVEMRKNGKAMPGLNSAWKGLIMITHP